MSKRKKKHKNRNFVKWAKSQFIHELILSNLLHDYENETPKENDKYLVQLLEKKNLKENERLITMNLLLKEYAFEKDGAVIKK